MNQMSDPATLAEDVTTEMSEVLVGMEDLAEQLTLSLLTGGHVLLEGVPGVAKTTLANTFAQATGLTYNRIQMTPDILPADITGTTVYREHSGDFELRKGPVFANVAVADELNRATPKTQSALLEAMAERHVSIDGDTLSLPDPFVVIATQNPIEMEGTFTLPQAQRDRFQQKLTVDLPNRDVESQLLGRFDGPSTMEATNINAVVTPEDIHAARDKIAEVHVEDVIHDYILDIVTASREHADVEHGASPRGSLALLHMAKAHAAIRGREYVISDDVKRLVKPVLRHRLVLTTEAELGDMTPQAIIDDLITSVSPPDAQLTKID